MLTTFRTVGVSCALLVTFVALHLPASGANESLFDLVRDGDTKRISTVVRGNGSPDIRDEYGATPLMYAAAYGSIADMQLLLQAGADVNARTKEGSTALLWATKDIAKVRVLLEAGADVNARSASGMTAFLSAAVRENVEVLRLLAGAGADTKAEMTLIPNTPIKLGFPQLAYFTNDPALRNLLSEFRIDRPSPQALISLPGSQPFSGLFVMTGFSMRLRTAPGIAAGVQAMLDAGADPNADIRQLARTLPPLSLVASFSDSHAIGALLAKGADPNRAGTIGLTPLMVAVSAEDPDLDSLRRLIDAGAEVNRRDTLGRTALDWALTQGESPVTAWLRDRGARSGEYKAARLATVAQPRTAREAVKLAIQQLATGGQVFHKKAACISCHHQSLPAVAMRTAAEHGIAVEPDAAAHPTEATLRMWAPSRENFLAGNCSIFGFLGNVSYGLLGMGEEQRPANPTVDAAVSCLSSLQSPDGRWEGGDMRPPLAGKTPFVYTALAIRALKTWTPGAMRRVADQQVARARSFLLNTSPNDTQGESFRLMGLVWSGASRAVIDEQARKLAGLQRKDGGWSMRPTMPEDAYITGQAMYALHVSGRSASSDVMQRGARYLLRTQLEDGTWYLASRTLGFQPYIDSGFPHGRDQFISAAATSWAAIALGLTL